MSVLMVAAGDILSNPYRNIKSYKISEEKIERLIASYDNSGFWDGSIQARPHPTKEGKYQIAFGHHRVEAAKRQGIATLGLVVAKRSNAEMLQMMHDENAEEFKHDALVAIEDIGAVIGAYERGEIELETPSKDGPKGSTVILPAGKIYSLATVARFLRWTKPSDGQATSGCKRAFNAYHEQAGTAVARELPLDKRSEVAVESVVTAAKAARKEAGKAGKSEAEQDKLARKAAEQQAEAVKKDSGFKQRRKARNVGYAAVHGEAPMPDLTAVVRSMIRALRSHHQKFDDLFARFDEAVKFAKELDSQKTEDAAAALLRTAEILEQHAGLARGMADRWIKRANIKNVTPAKRRVAGMLEESV